MAFFEIDMPEGAEMRFADYVLADIAKGNVQIGDSFMGGHYYCNGDRPENESWRGFVQDMASGNDWNLDVEYGFFRRVARLSRGNPGGKHYYGLKLTREEHRALVAAWDKLEAERKARNKAAKLARKRAEDRAAWWP